MEIERLPILRVTEKTSNKTSDEVVKESLLTIILNNQQLVTLLCSPVNLDYLAIGFLFSEGLIKSKEEIKRILIDAERGVVRVETEENTEMAGEQLFKRLITSGCGRGSSLYGIAATTGQARVESQIAITPQQVFALVNEFQHRSQTYRATGGVHSAALCNTDSILVFSEDIGRHNAIDKIFGECTLKNISTDNHLLVTSGRISSEILMKAARRSIPIIISISAPTNLGVRLAAELDITLVGFVRAKRMNVYTGSWRVKRDGDK